MKETPKGRHNLAPILSVEFHELACHVSRSSRDVFRINNTHRPRYGCSMASLYLDREIIPDLHSTLPASIDKILHTLFAHDAYLRVPSTSDSTTYSKDYGGLPAQQLSKVMCI